MLYSRGMSTLASKPVADAVDANAFCKSESSIEIVVLMHQGILRLHHDATKLARRSMAVSIRENALTPDPSSIGCWPKPTFLPTRHCSFSNSKNCLGERM